MYVEDNLQIIDNNEFLISKNELKTFFRINKIEIKNDEINRVFSEINSHPILMNMYAKYIQNGYIFNQDLVETINKYFFAYLDLKLFKDINIEMLKILLKIYQIEDLDVKKAIYITNNNNIEKILDEIVEKGTFFIKKENNYYFNDNIEKYLEYKYMTIFTEKERNEIYEKIAKIYEMERKNIKAARIYIKLFEHEKVCKLIENELTNHIGNINSNYIIKDIVKKLPSKIVEKYPLICSNLAVLNLLEMNIKEYEKWLEILEKSRKETNIDENTKRVIEESIYFCEISAPDTSSIKLAGKLKKLSEIVDNEEGIKQQLTLTGNSPSILSGSKDLCAWVNKISIMKELLKPKLEKIFNLKFDGIIEIAIGEVYYQKNKINDAIIHITKGLALIEKEQLPDIEFVGYNILSKIQFFNNDIFEYSNITDKMRNIIKEKNSKYLEKNLIASEIRFYILQKNKQEVLNWIEKNTNNTERFNILQRYKYLTLIRAYILVEDYQNALLLLESMYEYIKLYKRTFYQIEYNILKSIIMYKMDKEKEMLDYIEKALIVVKKYRFIRVFTDEGRDIYKILDVYSQKAKKLGNKEILELVEEIKLEYETIYKKDNRNNIKMTKSEIKILDLIKEGFTNDEIANNLYISKATVKTHINHIYSKLHVKNRTQALKKYDEIK